MIVVSLHFSMFALNTKKHALVFCVLCLIIGISDAWSSPLDIVEHNIDKVKELDYDDKEMCPLPSQNATQELSMALLGLMDSVIDAVNDLRDLSDRADKVYAISTMLGEEGLSLIQAIEMELSLQLLAMNQYRIKESNKQMQEQDRRNYEAWKKDWDDKRQKEQEEENWERWLTRLALTLVIVLLFGVAIPVAIVG